jgi:hypothetical protein
VPAVTLLSTLTESVEVPEPPLIDAVPSVEVRPEVELDEVNVTVPVNPFVGLTVMVVVPELPAWIVSEVGFEEREKSGSDAVNEAVAVCKTEPLVPVTVTVNVPLADAVHDRLEVPVLGRLAGVRLQVRPVGGDSECVKVKLPLKPFWKVTVTVDTPLLPTVTGTLAGLVVNVKPEMRNWIDAVVWEREPSMPVTVTV